MRIEFGRINFNVISSVIFNINLKFKFKFYIIQKLLINFQFIHFN